MKTINCKKCEIEINVVYHNTKLCRKCKNKNNKEYNYKYFRKEEVKSRLKEYFKKYREKNKEKIKKRNHEYHKKHYIKKEKKIKIVYIKPKKLKKTKLEKKEYNKKYNKEYQKQRLKKDKEFNLKHRLRCQLNGVLKKYTKHGKIQSSSKYGINYKEIIKKLTPIPEQLYLYHIDHIRPLCSFKLQNEDGTQNLEEIKKAFSPENLQWLYSNKNLKKSSKWDGIINK